MLTIATTLIALACALIAHRVTQLHDHLVEHVNRLTAHIKGVIEMSQQDTVNAIVEKLAHVKTEVVAKLTDLQAQIDAGVPAEQLDLGPLTEIATALDDIVPDVVPDAPVEEPSAPVE